MLRQRIITYIFLIFFIPIFIIYSDYRFFILGITLIYLLGAYEWLRLIGINNFLGKFVYLLSLILLMIISFFSDKETIVNFNFYIYVFAWSVIIAALYHFPLKIWWANKPIKLLLSYITMLTSWYSLIFLRITHGKEAVILLLSLVCFVDTFSFIAGKSIGKKALVPKISPKKTCGGAIGGISLSVFIFSIIETYRYQYPFLSFNTLTLILWVVVVVVIAIIGDLFISMMKRHVHLKDTGDWLPGHGGILDRIDSLIAAAPLFYYLFSMKLI